MAALCVVSVSQGGIILPLLVLFFPVKALTRSDCPVGTQKKRDAEQALRIFRYTAKTLIALPGEEEKVFRILAGTEDLG